MLPYRSHWHIAPQRDPWREARLLWVNAPDDDNAEEVTPTPEGDTEATQETTTAPTNATEQVRQNTRSRAQQTTATSATEEPEYLSASQILDKARAMQQKHTELIARTEEILRLLSKIPPSQEVSTLRDKWASLREQLHTQDAPLREALNTVEDIHAFGQGGIVPTHFINQMEERRADARRRAERSEDVQNTTTDVDPDVQRARTLVHSTAGRQQMDETGTNLADISTPEAWQQFQETHSEGSKETAIRAVLDTLNTDRELQEVSHYLQALENGISSMKLEEQSVTALEHLQDVTKKKTTKSTLNLEFYSALDFYHASKDWLEAFKSGWDRNSQLRRGKLQYMIAERLRWLPYGENAYKESVSKIDANHNKVKGERREELNTYKPKFNDLFGPEKKFRSAISGATVDVDYVMAIIEYAADQGWLYTLRDDSQIDGQNVTTLLPSHWTHHQKQIYVENLVSQNQNGSEKSRSETQGSMKTVTDQQKIFIDAFETYMHETNFPAAQGVMEAAYGRAVDANEGPRFAASFFRILREEPEVRRYMTPIIIQDFARLSAGKAYFTMTNLWEDRGQIAKACKDTTGPLNLENMGMLGKTIAKAEAQLKKLGGPTDKHEIDKKITDFLSGKAIVLPGGTMSIWEKGYDDYRSMSTNGSLTFSGMGSVKDTGADYFVSHNSEILLGTTNFVQALFRTTSQGTWEHQEFVENVAGRIFKRYQELWDDYAGSYTGQPKDHPAEKFKAEIGAKLQKAIQENISRSDGIATVTTKLTNVPQSTPILAGLQKLGFIKLQDMGPNGQKILSTIESNPNMQKEAQNLEKKIENAKQHAQTPLASRTSGTGATQSNYHAAT